MNKHYLIHLGAGNVGRTLVAQIQSSGAPFVYCGLFTSKAGVFKPDGLSSDELTKPVAGSSDPAEAIKQMPAPFTLIDTTASDATVPLLKLALERGGSVALSNKKPLAGSQAQWDELTHGPLYFETTVGAGLPVIGTLQSLLATGDQIEQVQGCFSGTLGYLFSQIEAGSSFSQAVNDAKAQGFTEPDPRDDLSGTDVARKVLVLARLSGQKLELSDIKLAGLFPAEMASLSVDDFMSRLTELDDEYAKRAHRAKVSGKVLRYVATIKPGACTVALEEVPAASDIGTLRGPDSIVVIRTKRYHDNPLVIKGPGAGLEVTAAGVFADVIKSAGGSRW